MSNGRTKLVGLVGVTAAAVLLSYVPLKESGPGGPKLVPYTDAVGVRTVCDGITKKVEERLYTKEECDKLLAEELYAHADGALRCLTKPTTPNQRAAYTSFAYNVGVTAFCRSTLVKKHNLGDNWGACAELPKWVYGGTTILPGLVIRRKEERALCEKDLKK